MVANKKGGSRVAKFQFGQESGRLSTTMWMSYLLLVIYLFNGKFLGWGGVLGLIFAGYVPLASLSPYPIILYSEDSYRPHLSHLWANV